MMDGCTDGQADRETEFLSGNYDNIRLTNTTSNQLFQKQDFRHHTKVIIRHKRTVGHAVTGAKEPLAVNDF